MLNGQDLIDLGYTPGKWFKEVLEYANKHQLEGADLIAFLDERKPKYLLPRQEALPYSKNIKAENQEEKENLNKVLESMNIVMQTPTVINGTLMPDACPAGPKGQIPVGGVAVAKNALHPAMHGADICCSLMMTDFGYIDPKKVLDAAHSVTHFGGGGREEFTEISQDLMNGITKNAFLNTKEIKKMTFSHLATQGDGNHFLFVGQSKDSGKTILVTHHGSRGVGAQLFKKGMQTAEKFRKEISPKTSKRNAWIPYETVEGKQYWTALQLVRKWTKLNHETIHDATLEKLKVTAENRFWNEHNFVFKENDLFYHAKGATPIKKEFVPDNSSGLRLVPLNMSQPILIVKGKTTENNLGFAPHGAGRNRSRTQHRKMNAHKTDKEIFAEETQGLDVRFFSNYIDISELPSAYKNTDSVKQQLKTFNLGEVVDEILPYGCVMAGDWQYNAPWRKRARKRRKDKQDN